LQIRKVIPILIRVVLVVGYLNSEENFKGMIKRGNYVFTRQERVEEKKTRKSITQ